MDLEKDHLGPSVLGLCVKTDLVDHSSTAGSDREASFCMVEARMDVDEECEVIWLRFGRKVEIVMVGIANQERRLVSWRRETMSWET